MPIVNCRICGKKFEIVESNMLSKGNSCSRECAYRARMEDGTNPRKGTGSYKIPCKMCGRSFKTVPSLAKIGQGIYCSQGCYMRHRMLRRFEAIREGART